MGSLKKAGSLTPSLNIDSISSKCLYIWVSATCASFHPSIVVFALMDDGIQEDEKAEIAKKLHEVLSEDSEEQDYSYARSKKLTFEIL